MSPLLSLEFDNPRTVQFFPATNNDGEIEESSLENFLSDNANKDLKTARVAANASSSSTTSQSSSTPWYLQRIANFLINSSGNCKTIEFNFTSAEVLLPGFLALLSGLQTEQLSSLDFSIDGDYEYSPEDASVVENFFRKNRSRGTNIKISPSSSNTEVQSSRVFFLCALRATDSNVPVCVGFPITFLSFRTNNFDSNSLRSLSICAMTEPTAYLVKCFAIVFQQLTESNRVCFTSVISPSRVARAFLSPVMENFIIPQLRTTRRLLWHAGEAPDPTMSMICEEIKSSQHMNALHVFGSIQKAELSMLHRCLERNQSLTDFSANLTIYSTNDRENDNNRDNDGEPSHRDEDNEEEEEEEEDEDAMKISLSQNAARCCIRNIAVKRVEGLLRKGVSDGLWSHVFDRLGHDESYDALFLAGREFVLHGVQTRPFVVPKRRSTRLLEQKRRKRQRRA